VALMARLTRAAPRCGGSHGLEDGVVAVKLLTCQTWRCGL